MVKNKKPGPKPAENRAVMGDLHRTMRISEEDFAVLERAADRLGIGWSTYVKRVAVRAGRRVLRTS